MNSKRYGLKGVNDEAETCVVCGKVELKRVMWIVELDADGNEISEPFHCGTTCGAKLLGKKVSAMVKMANSYKSEVYFRRSNIENNHPAHEAAMAINHRIISEVGFANRKDHAEYAEMMRLREIARQAAEAAVIVIEF